MRLKYKLVLQIWMHAGGVLIILALHGYGTIKFVAAFLRTCNILLLSSSPDVPVIFFPAHLLFWSLILSIQQNQLSPGHHTESESIAAFSDKFLRDNCICKWKAYLIYKELLERVIIRAPRWSQALKPLWPSCLMTYCIISEVKSWNCHDPPTQYDHARSDITKWLPGLAEETMHNKTGMAHESSVLSLPILRVRCCKALKSIFVNPGRKLFLWSYPWGKCNPSYIFT